MTGAKWCVPNMNGKICSHLSEENKFKQVSFNRKMGQIVVLSRIKNLFIISFAEMLCVN